MQRHFKDTISLLSVGLWFSLCLVDPSRFMHNMLACWIDVLSSVIVCDCERRCGSKIKKHLNKFKFRAEHLQQMGCLARADLGFKRAELSLE